MDDNQHPNNRRKDMDVNRIMEAIEQVGKRCEEQHVESQKAINDVLLNQTQMGTQAKNIESTISRVGEKLDKTSERVAALDANAQTLRAHTSNLFDKTNQLQSTVDVMSAKAKNPAQAQASFLQSDNFKWLLGAGLFISLLTLLAFGSITVSEMKEITPMSGK